MTPGPVAGCGTQQGHADRHDDRGSDREAEPCVPAWGVSQRRGGLLPDRPDRSEDRINDGFRRARVIGVGQPGAKSVRGLHIVAHAVPRFAAGMSSVSMADRSARIA